MNLKTSTVFGCFGALVFAVAFAMGAYASPLAMQGHARPMGIARNVEAHPLAHAMTSSAEREHGKPSARAARPIVKARAWVCGAPRPLAMSTMPTIHTKSRANEVQTCEWR